jgi:hypothetical protein
MLICVIEITAEHRLQGIYRTQVQDSDTLQDHTHVQDSDTLQDRTHVQDSATVKGRKVSTWPYTWYTHT